MSITTKQYQPSNPIKNVLNIPQSGFYTMPFPCGRDYSTILIGFQATFDSNSSPGIISNEIVSFGASGASTGFYISLISSDDFNNAFLPFHNGTIPSMGITSFKSAISTDIYLSGTNGLGDVGQLGYSNSGTPNIFIQGGAGFYYANGTTFGPILGAGNVPTNDYFNFVATSSQNMVNSYFLLEIANKGAVGQKFSLSYYQDPIYSGSPLAIVPRIGLNTLTFLLGNRYVYSESLFQSSILTGYWTNGFTAGGAALPLPNALATYNPFANNDLVLANVLIQKLN